MERKLDIKEAACTVCGSSQAYSHHQNPEAPEIGSGGFVHCSIVHFVWTWNGEITAVDACLDDEQLRSDMFRGPAL